MKPRGVGSESSKYKYKLSHRYTDNPETFVIFTEAATYRDGQNAGV